MKSVTYYSNRLDVNRIYLKNRLDFNEIDNICRLRLFPFEIDYIKDKLHTDNFKILYFYAIDENHKIIHLVNLDLYEKEDFDNCFINIYMPFLKLYYSETPQFHEEYVYVFRRKDKSIYEKVAPIYRPKQDRNNHWRNIEVGYVNKYGHKLINIYIRRSAYSEKTFSSLTGAGLVLDK